MKEHEWSSKMIIQKFSFNWSIGQVSKLYRLSIWTVLNHTASLYTCNWHMSDINDLLAPSRVSDERWNVIRGLSPSELSQILVHYDATKQEIVQKDKTPTKDDIVGSNINCWQVVINRSIIDGVLFIIKPFFFEQRRIWNEMRYRTVAI